MSRTNPESMSSMLWVPLVVFACFLLAGGLLIGMLVERWAR